MNYNYYPMYQNQNLTNPYNSNNFNQKIEVIKVNGKNGAEAFQLPPNSSAILLDVSMPLIWFVQTDGAGYKTCTPYKIEEYHPENEQDIIKSLESRIKKLEDILNDKSYNGTNEQSTNTAT